VGSTHWGQSSCKRLLYDCCNGIVYKSNPEFKSCPQNNYTNIVYSLHDNINLMTCPWGLRWSFCHSQIKAKPKVTPLFPYCLHPACWTPIWFDCYQDLSPTFRAKSTFAIWIWEAKLANNNNNNNYEAKLKKKNFKKKGGEKHDRKWVVYSKDFINI
jgi:hypothetical protein